MFVRLEFFKRRFCAFRILFLGDSNFKIIFHGRDPTRVCGEMQSSNMKWEIIIYICFPRREGRRRPPRESGGAAMVRASGTVAMPKDYSVVSGHPTTATPIWAARKWRKNGAGTQNLRHHEKFGGAGVAQACAGRRMGGASLRRAAQGRADQCKT